MLWNVSNFFVVLRLRKCHLRHATSIVFQKLGIRSSVLSVLFQSQFPQAKYEKKFLLFSALLVPLFGLHHFVAAFKPDSEGNTKFAIEVISALTISFQVSWKNPIRNPSWWIHHFREWWWQFFFVWSTTKFRWNWKSFLANTSNPLMDNNPSPWLSIR